MHEEYTKYTKETSERTIFHSVLCASFAFVVLPIYDHRKNRIAKNTRSTTKVFTAMNYNYV